MNQLRASRGFSLIEVVIAFAITCVLVAAAMPNFEDYGVRAKVTEALDQSIDAQSALVRTCMRDNQAVVRKNTDAGYRHVPASPGRDFVDHVDLSADCAARSLSVTVWTFNTGASSDPVIEWTAKVPSGVTSEGFEPPYYWNCRIIRGEFGHVPNECRKRYRKG